MPLLASRIYGTWSRYKYYHHQILSLNYGHMMSVTEELRSHFTRIPLLMIDSVRAHSTQNSQTTKWEKPLGYDSKIMIYHPLLKEKVPLILLQEKLVQWYTCGPTVYDSTHIGHASSYVRLDTIRRILNNIFNIDTTLVMGITDIDDKIILKTQQTGQTMNELTKFYESEFFTSLAKMNVLPPNVIVRVTDHVPHIIDFIAGIEKKSLTYKVTDGSIYFDITQYQKYGMFSNIPQGRASEVDVEKKAIQDFVLWKPSKPGEPSWESPWGRGRPGWHIECSAMASIFGANFDIHTGGEDLAFPHHENELAQSCAYHDRDQWANYWIHTGHLFLSGQDDKMSKSLKNVISVSEFLENYTPNHFRMLCLLKNYRNKIEFSEERMQIAVSTVAAFNNIINRCDLYVKGQIDCADIPESELYEKLHTTKQTIESALADDFNTPRALAHLMKLIKYTSHLLGEETTKEKTTTFARSNASVAAVGGYVDRVLSQLGLDLGRRKTEDGTDTQIQFSKAVDTVVSTRTKIRDFAKDKQFLVQAADEVGIPKDQALKLMKKLYVPLWDISDKIRADILNTSNVQINDDAVRSSWSFVDVKTKSSSTDLENRVEESSLKMQNKLNSNKDNDEKKEKKDRKKAKFQR